MTAPADAWQKVERAITHYNAIQKSTQDFIDANPNAFRVAIHPESGCHSLMAKVRALPPQDLGLIVGDFANNAKSALDYVVDRLSTLAPDSHLRKHVGFPIFEHPMEFVSRTGQPCKQPKQNKLEGIDPKWLPIFEQFQPYKGLNRDDPLLLLQEINNRDKHRSIRTTVALGEFQGFSPTGNFGGIEIEGFPITFLNFEQMRFGDVAIERVGSGEISEAESEVSRIQGRAGQMDFRPESLLTVKFAREQRWIENREVVPTLRSILDRVKEVLEKF